MTTQHSLNFASIILFNAIMNSKGNWIENNCFVITQTVANQIGIEATIEVTEDDVVMDAIRSYLLNPDSQIESFHNALVIMALFVVYTMAIDQAAIGTALDLTKFPSELGDNMKALVNAYESNMFYGYGRLERKYHELLNLMDCGSRYQPYMNGIVTFANQFARERELA